MLIEIKNLPQDKAVKHITIDITFDEDGTHKTKIKQDYAVPEVKTPTYGPPYIVGDFANPAQQVFPLVHPAIVDTHIHVGTTTSLASTHAIPKEMTDSEF